MSYIVFLASHIVSCFRATYVYLFETLVWMLGKLNVGDDESSCTAEARHIETPQQCGGGWGLVCVTPATIWPGSYFKYVSLDLVSVVNGTNWLFRQIQPKNLFSFSRVEYKIRQISRFMCDIRCGRLLMWVTWLSCSVPMVSDMWLPTIFYDIMANSRRLIRLAVRLGAGSSTHSVFGPPWIY